MHIYIYIYIFLYMFLYIEAVVHGHFASSLWMAKRRIELLDWG